MTTLFVLTPSGSSQLLSLPISVRVGDGGGKHVGGPKQLRNAKKHYTIEQSETSFPEISWKQDNPRKSLNPRNPRPSESASPPPPPPPPPPPLPPTIRRRSRAAGGGADEPRAQETRGPRGMQAALVIVVNGLMGARWVYGRHSWMLRGVGVECGACRSTYARIDVCVCVRV